MPIPPDPVTPGLLDLLTVAPLGEAQPDGEVDVAAAQRSSVSSRHATATPSGSRRLWVEVEVAPRA